MAPFLVPASYSESREARRKYWHSLDLELPGGQRDDSLPAGEIVLNLMECFNCWKESPIHEQHQTVEKKKRQLKKYVRWLPVCFSRALECLLGPKEKTLRAPRSKIPQDQDHPPGDAVPETGERGIPINDKCQEMIDEISKKNPRSLSVTASKRTCCIFKVPHTFVGNSYHPSVVSIGPYHHGKPQLMMIEEHKWRYLNYLLWRSKPTKTLEYYLESIKPLEKDAREYYSEILKQESPQFIEMMVLDGCFIIELFRKIKDPRLFEPNDPLATVGWVLPFLYRDFLLLENQIPFIILEKLFEISKMPSEEKSSLSLSLLAMQFFNEAIALRRPHDFICRRRSRDLKVSHLLDLVRLSFIPEELNRKQSSDTPTHIMHSFSRLRRSGIKLKSVKEESLV